MVCPQNGTGVLKARRPAAAVRVSCCCVCVCCVFCCCEFCSCVSFLLMRVLLVCLCVVVESCVFLLSVVCCAIIWCFCWVFRCLFCCLGSVFDVSFLLSFGCFFFFVVFSVCLFVKEVLVVFFSCACAFVLLLLSFLCWVCVGFFLFFFLFVCLFVFLFCFVSPLLYRRRVVVGCSARLCYAFVRTY